MRTRVKICGITRVEDALAAAESGADAIGLVFFDKSPRAVSVDQATEIVAALPPFVSSVGLFVNADAGYVRAVAEQVSLDLLQFHGDEDEDYCIQFARPYMKAIRMKPGVDLKAEMNRFASARALLLDTYVSGVAGGTGQAFDWSLVGSGYRLPVLLAGGLDPDNVGRAIAAARPYAVDVSGGVERAKGIKDGALIEAFIRGVNHG